MGRVPDWEPRLQALLQAARGRAFRYGKWDCGLFGGAVIEALTGEDAGARFRGRYTTGPIGYTRVLKREGFAGLFDYFDQTLGGRVGPLACRRGDLVCDGQNIGMMWVRGCLFVGGSAADAGRYEIGLILRPLSMVEWGWRIG